MLDRTIKPILTLALLVILAVLTSDCQAQRFNFRNTFSQSAIPTQQYSAPRFNSTPRFDVQKNLVPAVANHLLHTVRRSRHDHYYVPEQTYYQPAPIYQPVPAPIVASPAPVVTYPVVSQPAPTVSKQPVPAKPLSPLEKARQKTASAKSLFAAGNYTAAKKQLDEVVKLVPKDTNAYQFRALTLLAQKDFENAAADIYDALLRGNTWTRQVMGNVYQESRLGVYDNHVDKLEQAAKQNPTMQNHFLLAYHYLVNEKWVASQGQLDKVLQLQPNEPLSTKLLAAVEKRAKETSAGEKN